MLKYKLLLSICNPKSNLRIVISIKFLLILSLKINPDTIHQCGQLLTLSQLTSPLPHNSFRNLTQGQCKPKVQERSGLLEQNESLRVSSSLMNPLHKSRAKGKNRDRAGHHVPLRSSNSLRTPVSALYSSFRMHSSYNVGTR